MNLNQAQNILLNVFTSGYDSYSVFILILQFQPRLQYVDCPFETYLGKENVFLWKNKTLKRINFFYWAESDSKPSQTRLINNYNIQ